MGLEVQERSKLQDIVDEVVLNIPRGTIKNKLDNKWYTALCIYFNMKFKCGGFVADVYAQDVIEIIDLIEGRNGTL